MIRSWNIYALIIFVLFFPANSWAINYSVFSYQELFESKGAVRNADAAEQEAYQKEWQQRLTNMSVEKKRIIPERQKMIPAIMTERNRPECFRERDTIRTRVRLYSAGEPQEAAVDNVVAE